MNIRKSACSLAAIALTLLGLTETARADTSQVQPVIRVTGSTEFGTVTVGQTAEHLVELRNIGTGTAAIASYEFSQGVFFQPAPWTTDDCRLVAILPPGRACTIFMSVTPAVMADATATLRITFDSVSPGGGAVPPVVLTFHVYGAPAHVGTLYDDTNTGLPYYSGTWYPSSGLPSSTWWQGTAHSAIASGSYANVASYSCRRLQWLATRGPDRGIARIYVDGAYRATIDTYAPGVTASSVLYDTGVLPLGAHVLQVWVTGTHNGQSSASWVEVDAVAMS